jgi:hypothetical protein
VLEDPDNIRLHSQERRYRMNELVESMAALDDPLARFIGADQLGCLRIGLQGEEKEFFVKKIIELRDLVNKMPKTYEQEGKGDQAVICLHYFIGNCNWWITEKDCEFIQLQAFGLADLGYGAEYGYISIEELIENGVELDFYYKPRTLAER